MGRDVYVCGECMQGIDKNGNGHARHCGSRNEGNALGQMIHDRGPKSERSSSLDDVEWQHKRDSSQDKHKATIDKTLERAQGKAEGKVYRDTAPTPIDIPQGMVAKRTRRGYEVVYDDGKVDGIKGTATGNRSRDNKTRKDQRKKN